MKRTLIILLAVAGAAFAIYRATVSMRNPPVPPPIQEPVRNPYPKGIAGAGIVEPASESIAIGVSEPGRVAKVYVKVGQHVKKGDKLFETDASAMGAERVTAVAVAESAQSELQRVMAYRRKEDEAGLRAKLLEANAAIEETKATQEEAKAAQEEAKHSISQARSTIAENEWGVKDFEARQKRLEAAAKANATPEEEADRARYAVKMALAKLEAAKDSENAAKARLAAAAARLAAAAARIDAANAKAAQAKAELDTYLAGPWQADVKRAEASVAEAKARVERIDLEIGRRTVLAPLDAMVISCEIKEGEYAMANIDRPENARIVLGNLNPLHVRVDIDEFDAQRFKPGQKANAFLKGAANETPIPITFVRIEPFIVPKRALTNSQREVVDTRVLQVIFRIDAENSPVYVGQQLNVFIEESATK